MRAGVSDGFPAFVHPRLLGNSDAFALAFLQQSPLEADSDRRLSVADNDQSKECPFRTLFVSASVSSKWRPSSFRRHFYLIHG
jgi:hypothetical protein